jgi:segregation and condensation protein A
VSLQVAAHQTEGYTIKTDLYAGPLDLLLDLIERAELDITRLALAQVTDQYLAYIHGNTALSDGSSPEHDAAEVSAFLVIAARLVQIKSAALLPRPPALESTLEETDPAEALAQQLILYRRFKQLAGWIETRQNQGLRTYLRLAVGTPVYKTESHVDLSGVTLKDLVQAGWRIFGSKQALPALDQVVNLPRVTIRDRIHTILTALRAGGKETFHKLLHNRTRLEVVVTFLAMLELVKRHIITANQDQLFAEIKISATGSLEDTPEIEIDFTE